MRRTMGLPWLAPLRFSVMPGLFWPVNWRPKLFCSIQFTNLGIFPAPIIEVFSALAIPSNGLTRALWPAAKSSSSRWLVEGQALARLVGEAKSLSV